MWVEQGLGMMARRSAPRDCVEGKAPQTSRLWLRVCAGPTVFLRSVLCQSPLPHSSVPGSSLVGFLKQELASGRALVPFPSQASPPFPSPSLPATFWTCAPSRVAPESPVIFLSSSLFWLQLRTSVRASRKRNKQPLMTSQAHGSLISDLPFALTRSWQQSG